MYVLAWLIKAALVVATCSIIGYGIGKIGIDNLFD